MGGLIVWGLALLSVSGFGLMLWVELDRDAQEAKRRKPYEDARWLAVRQAYEAKQAQADAFRLECLKEDARQSRRAGGPK